MKDTMQTKREKKLNSSIILICIFLLGLSIVLYPSIADYVNSMNQSRAIASYTEKVDNMSARENARIIHEAEIYNRTLADTMNVFFKPEMVEGYWETLDITGTGIMGYITINKIGIELPIYHGTDEGVLQVAAGHLYGTSLPVGGENTHCVISAHRGLPSAKLFTNLDDLNPGDQFTITILDHMYTYQVDLISIVTPTDTDLLQISEGEDYVTLLTCTPYGINTHRLLVRGRRTANAKEQKHIHVTPEAFEVETYIVASILAIPMLLLLLIFMLIRLHDAKKRREELEREGQL